MTEQGNANATANIQTTTSTELDEPSKYNVILLNDDYTLQWIL